MGTYWFVGKTVTDNTVLSLFGGRMVISSPQREILREGETHLQVKPSICPEGRESL